MSHRGRRVSSQPRRPTWVTTLQSALGKIIDQLRSYSTVPEARAFLGMWMAH
ncbi:hypothetical protein [Nocardia abscessus]|uniref:hypothetical protein n=1 Tax=Nocardia abscessus TaxID=120957 RepID=UPI0024551A89|nr:hypothetical protein [Nocardia abscessus]